MALSPGTRLGHYDVTVLIGEGGMGQVWQATDTTLNRQVALKILPDAFADDPDRLARFQREAQVLASLNHPGIASIYGIEEDPSTGSGQAGTRALVLELVDGPTLADRMAHGAMPIEDALPIARQIVEALEAAHEAGVIHRDLKPANIKVREDGTVKVLDFGLAKALDVKPEGDPSQSPTLTAAATQMGVILGTAAYMSPKQARGHAVDARTDIWAFGVVLLEMLTGEAPFAGPTVSDSLARILEREPDLRGLPAQTPPQVRRLIRRCLEKDRRERLQHIGDARVELREALAGGSPDRDDLPPVVGSPRSPRRRPAVLALGAVALVAAFGLGWLARTTPSPPTEVTQLDLFMAGAPPGYGEYRAVPFALSPDGRTLIWGGDARRGERLSRRDLSTGETVPIPGTEGGLGPFFSPDGRWVAFFAENETALKRVSLSGGLPEPITELSSTFLGGSWGSDGEIVFSTASTGGLWTLPASGGEPTALTVATRSQDLSHSQPHHLPDGEHLLFVAGSVGWQDEAGEIHVVSTRTGDTRDRCGRQTERRSPSAPQPPTGCFSCSSSMWPVAANRRRWETPVSGRYRCPGRRTGSACSTTC